MNASFKLPIEISHRRVRFFESLWDLHLPIPRLWRIRYLYLTTIHSWVLWVTSDFWYIMFYLLTDNSDDEIWYHYGFVLCWWWWVSRFITDDKVPTILRRLSTLVLSGSCILKILFSITNTKLTSSWIFWTQVVFHVTCTSLLWFGFLVLCVELIAREVV